MPHTSSDVPSIAIIGLGLIGGSLAEALALKDIEISGYDPALKPHKKNTFPSIDFPGTLCLSLEELLLAAQQKHSIIIVAVPYPYLSQIFTAIAELTQDILITDVISVKAPVHELAKQTGIQSRFIGGHPMAGTHNSGWSARIPTLFHGKKWIITEDTTSISHPQSHYWEEILTKIGALPLKLTPAEHDTAVAAISHLPHILAEVLAVQGERAGELALELAASSFADGTRVAHTRWELVQAMVEPNQAAILPLLDATIKQLQEYREAFSQKAGLETLLNAGQQARFKYEAIHNTHSI